MNKILLFILSILATGLAAQTIENRIDFPDTLWAANDTFYVQGLSWDKEWSFSTTTRDTIDLGTDGYEGMKMKVWTLNDTLDIPYVNFPEEQWLFVPIASPKDTTVYRLRFNPQSAVFSDQYIQEHTERISFQVPETYELANVILYLTECSNITNNHPTKTNYSKLVNEHFASFKNHPIIKILNRKCTGNNHWSTYYGFRENSICFEFDKNGFLRYSTPYKHAWWDNSEIRGGEFRNLLYLIQDFSDKSRFREFYSVNQEYYLSLQKRQKELQPITRMWEWLEKEFPQKYDHYKIVFSPLIEGSHSTQKFYKGNFKDPIYQECIMFVNSSESIDSNSDYSEELRKGLLSGIVFTEIDHNYVNPTSRQNIQMIKELIIDKDKWATVEVQQNYRSEYAIFNEYMTHSLFCLYITENYTEKVKHKIIEKRIELMESRGFPKFKDFNNILIKQLKNRNGTIYSKYLEIIEEMKTIK